jgi:hypothetical protein
MTTAMPLDLHHPDPVAKRQGRAGTVLTHRRCNRGEPVKTAAARRAAGAERTWIEKYNAAQTYREQAALLDSMPIQGRVW